MIRSDQRFLPMHFRAARLADGNLLDEYTRTCLTRKERENSAGNLMETNSSGECYMSAELKNKVALVTGASRGLGAAIARKLAAEGAKVAVNTFGSPQKAQTLVDQIRKAGGVAEVFKANVTDEREVTELVAQTKNAFGPIDILVINATGPQPFLTIEELTWRACLDQLEFFVKSPVLLMKAVVGSMKERRYGRVINIGSEVFERGVPQFSNYVSAKGAQLGLTRSWALELARWQITVNLVAPGWIPTERHDKDPQQAKDAYAAGVPMGRMGVADDIANAVAFLASDRAQFITGQKLSVNGANSLA
jgi:NAD(P)-dependent dehydrogenase (short-subunit alcohol dehydrogenase family)